MERAPLHPVQLVVFTRGAVGSERWTCLCTVPSTAGAAGQLPRTAGCHAERTRPGLWLILLLVLVGGAGGGYYGYSQWGPGRGLGIAGTVLLVVVLLSLVGGLRSHG